jgi:hypothetical protein
MHISKRSRRLIVLAIVLMMIASLEVFSTVSAEKKKKQHASTAKPVLWRNTENIRDRDLYYGPGSKDRAPVPPFRFVKEVKEGGMPKFDVEDARGVKWRVKLGPEAQAETVASRLVWAAGYNAEESYYLDRANIDGLKKLSRGQKYVSGQSVQGARFEPRRDNIKRGKEWDWNKNPFKNTRELNGLKTMMVLLNNWDVFKKNNRVLHDKDTGEDHYTVTDLGATMGAAAGIGGGRSKNNVQDYQRKRLVKKVENGNVKFDYDVRPKGFGRLLSVVAPPLYFRQRKATKTVQKVPVEHAAWMGSVLGQLSDDQLRDSLRAAGYDRSTQEAYLRAIRGRINELNQLKGSQLATRERRTR